MIADDLPREDQRDGNAWGRCFADFVVYMMILIRTEAEMSGWFIHGGEGPAVQKRFKIIRHVREQNPEPERTLKGICKIVAQRKLREAEAEEEEQEDECGDEGEQGEEEEMEDDECLGDGDLKKDEVKVAEKAKTPRESPVRRLDQKTPASCEETLFIGTKDSKERQELDDVMEKIKLLEIARSET
ncbi:unnamed protein product [Symbiodinium microadriaticum]|nr:unnamed protein product [Symbiodinium microadriaticum]CAE7621595.1 unnamed protein product [Symbiodinium sp. KB8]